ncbi:LuxR family transcriptional regulator [Gordonia sp. OPL2]|uniref:helix-turn-helix transcriptional regulator n=1 Tax=Gordonia sp. OPL2 TaxID=2486274 RepID=UPI0016558D9D|nr:LuxR family transcriptional regulator [Gordonia sp. OPL2]RPA19802.1 LuxR family transcriptional regulator [Gordonia sp. OPL2]
MGARWQLLSRPTEQHAIRAALANADTCGVVLVGAAGVGKTTLARQATDELAAEVRWAACTESSRGIPLGAFAPWVESTSSRDPITALVSARDSLLAHPDTIVGVDDAHHLDQLSATLLLQLAVDRSARIVATVRTGEPVTDAVTALWKDGHLIRIDLESLTKAESTALVERVLGGALEGLSADVIWDSSGGNPLFLRNLVEGAVRAGTLSEVNGVWQLRGPTAVPSGLVSLVDDRLDHAGAAVMDLMRLLAVCEPLDIDSLITLAGGDAVDEAELSDLVRIVRDGSTVNVRFSHPVYGDVIRRRIGVASGRTLRSRIVEILRQEPVDTAAARIRLAQLCVDGDLDIEPRMLTSAAKDAVALANLPLGERLARAAAERGGGLAAAELLSRALLWQARPVEADEALATFDPDQLDELQLVLWGNPRLSLLFWSLGEDVKAKEILSLLHERVTHPALVRIVEGMESMMAVHENRIDEGIAVARAVIADPDAPPQAFDFAAFATGLAMPVAGQGLAYDPIAARCRAEQKPTDGMIKVMVRYCDVLALTMIGDLDTAQHRADEYNEFSSAGQFLGWAIAKITVGVVATYRGSFTAATSAFEQALAALNAENSLPWRLPARLLLARAYAALGDVVEAERVLAEADEHTGPQTAIHEPQRVIARAWIAAANGAQTEAVELCIRAADIAHDAGQFALEAEACHHAARFGERGVGIRIESLVDRIDGSIAALYARHAMAVGAGDADALDTVSQEFEEVGFLLSAADSAAQAAPLHEKAGRRRGVAESSARALKLSVLCDRATTPALRASARPLPVTAREREITALVAQGLSNREIAERLTVSVRTVEGHIYRACIKLDVADRDALAQVVWDVTR